MYVGRTRQHLHLLCLNPINKPFLNMNNTRDVLPRATKQA